jgi:hypothetical protein
MSCRKGRRLGFPRGRHCRYSLPYSAFRRTVARNRGYDRRVPVPARFATASAVRRAPCRYLATLQGEIALFPFNRFGSVIGVRVSHERRSGSRTGELASKA